MLSDISHSIIIFLKEKYFTDSEAYMNAIDIIMLAFGVFCIFYIALFILRHVLLYYIIKHAKKLLPKKYQNRKKYTKPSNREDELLRSEKKERTRKFEGGGFVQAADDDVVHGDVEKIGGSELEQSAEISSEPEVKIVGMVDPSSLGPIAQKILGKKMRDIAAMMQAGGNIGKGYWVSYLDARRQADKQQQSQYGRNT